MKPTHAGGLVYRLGSSGSREYLLVTSRTGDWVLPKGHIEAGETDEEAAVREIQEEAGVTGTIVRHITNTAPYNTPRENNIIVSYYLVQYASEEPAGEGRGIGWYSFPEAMQLLKHDALREVLTAGGL